MGRRSNLQLLVDALKEQTNNQGSPKALGALLGWEPEKVTQVAKKPEAVGAWVSVGKGGVIQFRGRENHSNGLYADVARVIETYWGPRQLGLRNIDTIATAQAGTRGTGVWTHPDLVVAADPRRRVSQDEPRRLHAIEVENSDGFDLRSVYQAHAQGRGANYSWVFGNKAPGVEKKDWDRIVWTAEQLEIGLVTFVKPGAYGTWTTWVEAVHKGPAADERDAFIATAIGPSLQEAYEL